MQVSATIAGAALVPCFLLFVLSGLSGLLFQAPGKTGRTRMAFDPRGGDLGDMAHLHGSIAHRVFGVFETSAIKENVLCNTHFQKRFLIVVLSDM